MMKSQDARAKTSLNGLSNGKTISRCDSYGWRLGILMTKSKIMMLSPSTFQKATVYLCRTANSAILLFKTLCVPNADN